MKALQEFLRNVQLVTFGGLAVAAFLFWRRLKGESAGWLAATFGSIGIVVIAARLLPQDSDSTAVAWLTKLLIVVLVLFPYLLYRFSLTFVHRIRWIYAVATALTLAVIAASLVLPAFPKPGEPRTPIFQAFLIMLIVQWVYLSVIVVVRLWSAGRGQPSVARRRMRTLALGALGLAIAIVISGLSPTVEDVRWPQIAQQLLGLATAPLFLLGFSPPPIILAIWRRKDELKLREAEIGLVRATKSKEVADGLLPHATALIGGHGALLYDLDTGLIGSFNLSRNTEASLVAASVRRGKGSEVVTELERIWVPLESGWLVFLTSKYTPFFGIEETNTLRALAVLTDLALARAELIERERQQIETMRDFVAIASHDLRTPITVVEGFTATLEARWDQIPETEKRRFVRSMGRQIGHLKRLVEDMLTVSRLEAGGISSMPEEIELEPSISQTVRDLQDQLHPIELDLETDLFAYVDKDHLERMITNYLHNATVYGEPPIRIEAKGAGEFVEVLVIDSGTGVPEEFVPRLFGKFERANRKMAKAVQGTGLGLSIVRGLARTAGGDTWYEPNQPSGSVFGVRLPRVYRKSR